MHDTSDPGFPGTLEEAERRMTQLLDEIQTIHTDLGNRNRLGPGGCRLTAEAYFEWRNRATKALRYKNREYRHLKDWVKQKRIERPLLNPDGGRADPLEVLAEADSLLDRLITELGRTLVPHEQAIRDRVQAYAQIRARQRDWGEVVAAEEEEVPHGR